MKDIHVDREGDFDSVSIRSDRIEESLAVMKKTGIKNLAINPVYGWKKGKTLDFLQDNTWVEGVNLVEEDLDISVLNQLKQLQILALSANRYKGQLDLKNFPDLKSFGGPWISKQFSNLNTCSRLKYLGISKFPWQDLKELTNFKVLEKLEINYGKLTSLQGIEQLVGLKDLTIYSHPGLTSLEGIQKIAKNLKGLSFENCKGIEDYAPLEALHDLETLVITASAPVGTVKFIRKMKKLRYCYIGTEILDNDPEPLKEKGFEFKRSKNYK